MNKNVNMIYNESEKEQVPFTTLVLIGFFFFGIVLPEFVKYL